MNTIGTKQLLLLAAAALATAACDPFPAAPSGPLEVFHVGSTGGNPIDIASPADPMAVVVDEAAYDASFYVWFTKEMDGKTIQQFPDIDPATGLPTDVPNVCEYVGSPLEATSSGWPDGTSVCYAPGSATGGGLIQVFPPEGVDGPIWWEVGSYVLAGTVKDIGGASIQFHATFNVTLKPTLVKADPYTIDLAWPQQPGATGYTIERIQSDTEPTDWTGSTWLTNVAWLDPNLSAVNGVWRDYNKEPGTTYWYRITPEGVAGAPSTAASATLAAAPAIKAQARPVSSAFPEGEPNVVQVVWSRIRANANIDPPEGSAAYRVERSTDDGATWTALTVPALAPSTASTRSYRDTGVAAGTYPYRIVPVFDGGVDGVPTKAATVTMP